MASERTNAEVEEMETERDLKRDEIAVLRAALKANPEAHAKLRALALSGKIQPCDEWPADEPLVIVAGPNHCGIEGAKQAKCECGAIVWLGTSTQAMLIKRGAIPHRVICHACFTAELKTTHVRPNA
jgi:hypothetical protein